MDALKRPLRIPPEFGIYAEEKGVFQLYQRMLQELIVARPEDPLQFLADYLGRRQEDGQHPYTVPYPTIDIIIVLKTMKYMYWIDLRNSLGTSLFFSTYSAQSDYIWPSGVWPTHAGKSHSTVFDDRS